MATITFSMLEEQTTTMQEEEIEVMEIYNITQERTFVLQGGKELRPQTGAIITKEEGEKLLRLYNENQKAIGKPAMIIRKDEYKANNILGAEILNEEIDKVRAENKELKATIAELKSQLADLYLNKPEKRGRKPKEGFKC